MKPNDNTDTEFRADMDNIKEEGVDIPDDIPNGVMMIYDKNMKATMTGASFELPDKVPESKQLTSDNTNQQLGSPKLGMDDARKKITDAIDARKVTFGKTFGRTSRITSRKPKRRTSRKSKKRKTRKLKRRTSRKPKGK